MSRGHYRENGEEGYSMESSVRRSCWIGGAALMILATAVLVVSGVDIVDDFGGEGAVILGTVDPELRKLEAENALAAHAVNSFSTTGQEGFSDEDGFRRDSDGVAIGVAKSLDTLTNEDKTRFRQISKGLEEENDDAAHYLNTVVSVEQARQDAFIKDTTARWAKNRAQNQAAVDYSAHTSPVTNPDADFEGRKLKDRLRQATKYVDEISNSEESSDAASFKKLVTRAYNNQARLAGYIVGMRDPTARSADELNLLSRDEQVAKCISSGDWEANGCS